MQVKKEWRQVNEKGHIGIVEKVQETSSDTGMHTGPLLCYMNCECVLESRDIPTAGNNLIPISVPLQCSCVGYVHFYTCI